METALVLAATGLGGFLVLFPDVDTSSS